MAPRFVRQSPPGRSAAGRRRAMFALAAVLVVATGCKLSGPAGASESATPAASTATLEAELSDALGARLTKTLEGPALEAHFMNIGQGDAILLRSPAGKTVLIDTGPPGADDVLRGYLDGLGVDRIDLMVNTHPHSDHIGNTRELLSWMPVGRIFDSGFAHPTATYEKLLEAIEARRVPLRIVRGGQVVNLDEGIRLEVLGPADPLIDKSRSDANANSVIIRVDYGEVSFLLTGDAEEETEDRLLAGDPAKLRATVLKVAHHGSKHATHQRFLDAVSPALAVISCSADNTYGHPAPETMQRLKKKGVPALVTSKLGHVIVATDGRQLTVNHDHALPRRTGDARLDLNSATRSHLEALPGIGEALADRIVRDRAANGPFRTVDALTRVNGIGEATVEQIRPMVTVR